MTEESSTPPAPPAGLAPHHQRLFALILDYLLVVGALNMAQKLLLGNNWDLNPPSESWLVMLAPGAFLILFKDILGGVSPGRWITGIAVALASDPTSAPPWPRLVVRNIFLLLLPVEAVLVFFDPFYRRWGDRVAGTVVVAPKKVAPYTRRLLGLTILFMVTTLIIFGLEFWNVRRSAAYRTALEAAAKNPKVFEAVGEVPSFGTSPGLIFLKDQKDPQAEVTLKAEGKLGAFEVKVALRRKTGERRWRVEKMTISQSMDR